MRAGSDYVIVTVVPEPKNKKSAGGLHLPETTEFQARVKIAAIGKGHPIAAVPDQESFDHTIVYDVIDASIGDEALVNKSCLNHRFTDKGQEYYIVHQNDVFVIFDEEEE